MAKQIPILYSTPMVQAVINRIKTVTRRLTGLHAWNKEPDRWKFGYTAFTPDGHISARGTFDNGQFGEKFIKCPYGKKGDVLWVRETFGELYDTCDHDELPGCPQERWSLGYKYKADGYVHENNFNGFWTGWKPSIHMPKVAARIWLEVTDIKVERLQDITEEQAKAEGAYDTLKQEDLKLLKDLEWTIPAPFRPHQFGFLALWCKINGVKSWEANPWVWCVSFKQIDKPLCQ